MDISTCPLTNLQYKIILITTIYYRQTGRKGDDCLPALSPYMVPLDYLYENETYTYTKGRQGNSMVGQGWGQEQISHINIIHQYHYIPSTP